MTLTKRVLFLLTLTILSACTNLRTVGGGTGSEPELSQAGFIELPQRPSQADLRCANHSRTEWAVSVSNGVLRITLRSKSDFEDPLPFAYERGPDRQGYRHVVQVADGWLVGFDAGEFGGGLWWFSTRGERSVQLRPPANAPVHPDDIFQAENVRGFARHGHDLLIFMGLDHRSGRSGRVFRLVQQAGHWTLSIFAVLDASPAGWVVDHDRILVLTESGLWQAMTDGRSKKLHSLDVGSPYPNSMVLGREGALYIGMRRYVLRLKGSDSDWSETWFVQSGCVKAEIRNYECQCVP